MFEKLKIKRIPKVVLILGIIIGVSLIGFIGFRIYQDVKNLTKDDSSNTSGTLTSSSSQHSAFDFSSSNSSPSNGSKSAPAFKVSDKESGLADGQKPAPVPTVTTPKVTTTTTTTTDDDKDDEETDDDSIPDDNDSPSIEIVTDGIEDETLSSSKPVYLIATASDNVGGVSSVEFYINGKKKATVESRTLYAKSASGWDSEDADEATEKAISYLEDKYDESDLSYIYRKYNKFDTDEGDCDDIDEGYILILLGKNNLYDVRVSEDLDDLEVCYKGTSLNYNNKYLYLFSSGDGSYNFYAKAYDTYDASTKSEDIDFKLD